MARLIWWLMVGALAWWALRKWLRSDQPHAAPPPAPSAARATNMVACAHCGLHLPETDAICTTTDAGPVFYCSPEHARANAHHPER